jgi:indole-3-glycerol phosphate synthase
VQAPRLWSPPAGTLGAIVEQTALRVRTLRARRSELERALAETSTAPPFASGFRGPLVGVIAEVKRMSPSKGLINAALDAPVQAAAYEAGGAAAVSVLTERAHFGGSEDDLVAVLSRVSIPVLKKDFHLDAVQLLEARVLGAAAALLIARAIAPADLAGLVAYAGSIGLETLVEIRTVDELERALGAGATVIGVNARDLETLEVDVTVAERLMARIPRGVVAIWESGIQTARDVERAASAGADAVLVGSAVSAAEDPGGAVRALAGTPREAGARD